MEYLLGTPVFDTIPFKGGGACLIPMGQVGLARELLRRYRRPVMVDRLRREYRAVAGALDSAGAGVRVLNLDDGDRRMARWLRDRGFASLRFVAREATRWHLYPRDLFVYAETANVLLAHSELFRLRSDHRRGCRIVHSGWAEGGRVLMSGDRMIVSRHPEVNRVPRARAFDILRERGMTIAAIPQPIACRIDRRSGRAVELTYDDHLDRSAALLRDGDGRCHLVLDPGYRTGPVTLPLSVESSIDRVRRICDRIEVEVHVPERISVPYATAAVQLSGGKVLAAGGDSGVLNSCGEVAGPENVVSTRLSIEAYPVFAAAGLHCLVTELPEPLVARAQSG
jgi:hypothetical protein